MTKDIAVYTPQKLFYVNYMAFFSKMYKSIMKTRMWRKTAKEPYTADILIFPW